MNIFILKLFKIKFSNIYIKLCRRGTVKFSFSLKTKNCEEFRIKTFYNVFNFRKIKKKFFLILTFFKTQFKKFTKNKCFIFKINETRKSNHLF